MKVIAFNGSPRKEGNTYTLLQTVLKQLEEHGIETELIQVGNRNIHGCIGCGKCRTNGNNRCIFDDDIINECIEKIVEADGIILGSPVYFGGLSAQMKAFIDRVGYVTRPERLLKRKVCSAVVSQRRDGAIAAFNSMNNLFTISESIIVGANYWNLGLGRAAGDVVNDTEGIENMKNLGDNMAWLLDKIK
ncbi:flavodoxin family protein [Vallitalea guaymasensis]|uniref:flavodoxin family protein n=1 Tax=Vallitalea guaymasensis TaxID=1185412 RepID=UPI002352835A|nr:flavodoxin family protein [Vallitalea guaymasensis]